MAAPYVKRYPGGFLDLPSQTTPVDSAFLNAVEAALLHLLGEAPAVDEVGVWSAAGGGALVYQKITNAQIAAGAAIDKSKLAALNIADADIAAAAGIAKSKLAALNIVNADVDAAAAIAATKLLPLRVATTVAGLGAGAAGVAGLLRLGATPFEFVLLAYDATYAKWVSPEVLIFDTGTVISNFNTIGENDLFGAGVIGIHNYRNFQAGGLVPYFRATGLIGKTSAGANSDMTLAMQMATHDEAAQEAATGAYTASFGSVTKTITGTNIVGYDTGWVTPGALPTVGDRLTLKLRANVTNNADAKQWRSLKVYLRWAA